MSDQGRQAVSLKRILGKMAESGFVNQDLRDAVMLYQRGIQDQSIKSNARTLEDKVHRTEVLMRGIEGARGLAELWSDGKYDDVGSNTEAGLRARLADEISVCLRGGGVITPDGELHRDVPSVVLGVIDELDPSLTKELVLETKTEKEFGNPSVLEGN